VRDVGIASVQPPFVSRGQGSATVYLTFCGVSDIRSSVDRDTRVRISVPASTAAVLWRLLGEALTEDEKAM
jgi:hypothetical protein